MSVACRLPFSVVDVAYNPFLSTTNSVVFDADNIHDGKFLEHKSFISVNRLQMWHTNWRQGDLPEHRSFIILNAQTGGEFRRGHRQF